MDSVFFNVKFLDFYVPEVTKYLRELPIKTILLIDNAPSYPATNVLFSCYITVKFFRLMWLHFYSLQECPRRQVLSQLIQDEGEHSAV